jgi:hypothetical protein
MFAPSAPKPKEPPKVLSLDLAIKTTVMIEDLWREHDRKDKRSSDRIA